MPQQVNSRSAEASREHPARPPGEDFRHNQPCRPVFGNPVRSLYRVFSCRCGIRADFDHESRGGPPSERQHSSGCGQYVLPGGISARRGRAGLPGHRECSFEPQRDYDHEIDEPARFQQGCHQLRPRHGSVCRHEPGGRPRVRGHPLFPQRGEHSVRSDLRPECAAHPAVRDLRIRRHAGECRQLCPERPDARSSAG